MVSGLYVDFHQMIDIRLPTGVQPMELPVKLSCKRDLAAAGAAWRSKVP